MFKADPIQTNFSSGELSPHLFGRTDIERYRNGAELVQNFMVRHQGGVAGRRGTKYVETCQAQAAATNVRLVDFVYSRTDALVIEFTYTQIRFYKDGASIDNAGAPYEVSVIHGTSPYLALPYTNAQIPELQFTQSADVLYITHPLHPQATLSRYGTVDWRFEQPEMKNGPYLDRASGDEDISLTVINVTDRVILESSEDDFTATVAGDLIEYQHAGQKVLGLVTISFNSRKVEVEPLEDRSLFMPKEVYSPGLYTGWNATDSIPIYSPSITGNNVQVAFSAISVITQEHIGNYLRFASSLGVYYWMLVESSGDILRSGSYGILAGGDVVAPLVPTGRITRSERNINARLRASVGGFFDLDTDYGRLFRLVLGGKVVHARGRAQFARAAEVDALDRNIGMFGNTSGLLVGDTVSGTGIPAGSIIEYIVENQYIHISLDPTVTSASVSLTFNANSLQEMGVELNRSLPKSIEGLTSVDSGTTNDWSRGAWFTANYPSTVSFHEGRLAFAGSPLQPHTGWLSKVDDFDNFATTDESLRVADDAAITFTIASDTVNIIQWMLSSDVLILGTVGAEWKVGATTQGAPLTPTTISVRGQSTYGSAYARPISIGASLLYLQRGGRKLRQMKYDYQVDKMVSLDLTVFAEHIFRTHGNAQQIVYQQLPESVVYVRLGDGQIAVLAYEPDQQVYAFSRFILGGPDAFVESMAVIPGTDRDLLYLVVSRTIEGANYRTVEFLEPEFHPTSSTDKDEMIYLDCYSEGTSLTNGTIPDLARMNGEEVTVLIDNLPVQNVAVAASVIYVTASVTGGTFNFTVFFFVNENYVGTCTFAYLGTSGGNSTYRYLTGTWVHTGPYTGVSQNNPATANWYIEVNHGATTELLGAGIQFSVPTGNQFRIVFSVQAVSGYGQGYSDYFTSGAEAAIVAAVAAGGLREPVTRWAVGFPYRTLLKTFPLEIPVQTGTTQHKKKRIDHLNLRLLDTIDFQHGRSLSTLRQEDFRVAADPVDSSPPMFSGDKEVVFECGFDERAQVYIVQDKPYPITLLSLTPEVGIY